MSKQYQNLPVQRKVKEEFLPLCIKIYREHHPELNAIPITYNKIIFEIIKFYLKDTKFNIKNERI